MHPIATAIRIGWPIVLWIGVMLLFGGLGFSPTDEGFVNTASYRVLQGQVPHVDWIWPRPGGTAYVHALEQLLPTPSVMTSRGIALAQVIGYSMLFAVLVVGRPPWRWSLPEVGVVAAAVLLNLGTMPLMSWPTTDGLLLVATGAVLLRAALARQAGQLVMLAFLAFGAATLMKQSFWPAPIFALVWMAAAVAPALRARYMVMALAAAATPPLCYLLLVGSSGGIDAMLLQLTSARPAMGIELFDRLPSPELTIGLGLVVGALTLIPPGRRNAIVRHGLPLVVVAAVAVIVWLHGLELGEGWAAMLWWLVVARVAAQALRDREIDWPGLVMVGIGWMTSLSWGLASPDLVAGTLAAYLVLRSVEDAQVEQAVLRPRPGPGPGPWPRPRTMWLPGAIAAALLTILVTPRFVVERLEHTYRDRPADELTADLGRVHEDFAGVWTNPVTAEYLSQMLECVRDHPADEVAVLPDAPMLYPVLQLSNPLPVDWVIPLELVGSEDRVVDAARALDARGNYLVLFAPVPATSLHTIDALERAPGGPFRDPALGLAIRSSLGGTEVACGDFVGVWAAAQP